MAELTVFSGPMCAGKSKGIISSIDSSRYQAFRPTSPERPPYASSVIASRDGEYLRSTPVSPYNGGADDIVDAVLGEEFDIVGIDDAHFFGEDIVGVVQELLGEEYDVLVAGLDRDFRGEPFTPIPKLQRMADENFRLTADCEASGCGAAATLTQKLIDGEPAPYDAPQLQSEVEVRYEPRCPGHHDVPR